MVSAVQHPPQRGVGMRIGARGQRLVAVLLVDAEAFQLLRCLGIVG
ncbi:hypothetical protein ABN034_28390 [Actinopolymorpha sp. B11F2]